MHTRIAALGAVLALAAGSSHVSVSVAAQSKTAKPAAAQKVDEEYTRLIKQNLQDPQTQGTYTLGFNAIMNWNDLDAGKVAAPGGRGTTVQP